VATEIGQRSAFAGRTMLGGYHMTLINHIIREALASVPSELSHKPFTPN
jgi:hypothetical protein